MKRGRKVVTTIILILVIVGGLGFMLYPTISDYVNSLGRMQLIEAYNRYVQALDTETYEKILSDAAAYNEQLSQRPMYPLALSDEDRVVYEQMLDVNGSGIMGYIEIPDLSISLPIYHGTSAAVLQSGVGHMEGTSLPVGGENTHAVLSGHTGLPSSKLFTNIDRMKVGDTFTVRVLSEVLTYEVDQIEVVLPYILNNLDIEPGMDYCTLVTCTPYGVNSHRLLVRGHRIPTPQTEQKNQSLITNFFTLNNAFDPVMLIPAGVALVVLLWLIMMALHYRRKKRKTKKAKNPDPPVPSEPSDPPGTKASEPDAPTAPDPPEEAPPDKTE